MMGYGFSFGFWGMILFWGAFLALLIGGAIVLFRQTARPSPSPRTSGPTARQILDQRLARGEIDQDEYNAIRAQIEKS